MAGSRATSRPHISAADPPSWEPAATSHTTHRRALITLCASLLGALALASSAQAFYTHVFDHAHSPFAATTHQPIGIAVDNSGGPASGDVYISSGNSELQRFKENGEPAPFTATSVENPEISGNAIKGIGTRPFGGYGLLWDAVDPSGEDAGHFFVADPSNSAIEEFNEAGKYLGEFTFPGFFPSGVAIDTSHGPNGYLYATDRNNYHVERFDLKTRELVSQFPANIGVQIDSVAVSAAGDVYVVDQENTVTEYNPSSEPPGENLGVLDANGSSAVAIDASTGDIYTYDNGGFHHYGSGGDPFETFNEAGVGRSYGIAINTSTHVIYTEEYNENDANVFKTATTLANAITKPTLASNIGRESATVTGQLDPDSAHGGANITECKFEYVEGAKYNPGEPNPYSAGPSPVSCEQATPITAPTEVSSELSGLSGLTTYHYRLVATTANGTSDGADKTFTTPAVLGVETDEATEVRHGEATLHGEFNPEGLATTYHFEYGTEGNCAEHACTSKPSPDAGPFSGGIEQVSLHLTNLQPEATYSFRIAATNKYGTTYGKTETFLVPPAVKGVITEAATDLKTTEATLHGKLDPDELETEYHFQYGLNTEYGQESPTIHAGSTPGEVAVTPATITGLEPNHEYHFRLVAHDSVGTTYGQDKTLTTLTSPPSFTGFSVTEVHADSALLGVEINPGGGETTYHFEYGPEECLGQMPNPCESFPIPDGKAGSSVSFQNFHAHLFGLSAETEYHWRVVATNSAETAASSDHVFTTFPSGGITSDPCPNAHVRQQTGAALLPDCRAYELVSAADTGGYDVESPLVAGQAPYAGYPQASNPPRVLYAVHDGGIPGTNHPTNKGPDPYVATRGKEGWSTAYVGVPANDPFAKAPFTSVPSGSDASLETFAFGGPGGCSPCFEGSYTGIPLHLPDGELVQGMVGSINPGSGAKPDGYIAKDLSANGEHFIFGSTSQFEPGGNNETGDVSIYDHNLKTDQTHVVSDTPGGTPLACEQDPHECHSPGDGNGIAELDISSDGSHILLGQKVGVDADGNVYWHLYMDINDNEKTIDLTPGASNGVLYDGMTEDGSKVFFTTKDALTTATNQDTDHSADIYQAEASGSGATLTRISSGIDGTGNTDSCTPTHNWNTISGGPNCSAVAIGGHGGVASTNGTIYFLSPELLDGPSNGSQNEPNLYVVRPGSPPHFVATLETSVTAPRPETTSHSFFRYFGSLSGPDGIAANQGSNEVYVIDPGRYRIDRYDSSGNLISYFGKGVDQSTGGDICTAASHDTCQPGTAGSQAGEFSKPTFVAVDNSTNPSDPSAGDVYVADTANNKIQKFAPDGSLITSWGNSTPTPNGQLGGFSSINGITVNSSGNLVVLEHIEHEDFFSNVYEYTQAGAIVRVFQTAFASNPDGIAVDSSGNIYMVRENGEVAKLSPSGSAINGSFDQGPATGLAIDSKGDLYVSHSTSVDHLDSSGTPVEKPIGLGYIGAGLGVAVDGGGNIYVSDHSSGHVAAFAEPSVSENPVVTDSVREAETRKTADFQVNPTGEAVFTTALPLKVGYKNGAEREIYRYDPLSTHLDCVSCNPTNADATGSASLAANGLSITNDGRVFFNSTDALAPRDLDEKEDVYEWEAQGTGEAQGKYSCQTAGGCVELISTGSSPFSSDLLGVSADGTDAYFFTHDSLVPQDENGTLAKIYDARELGGFLFIPKSPPCAASDECHGPGTHAPPSPQIGTVAGGAGNVQKEANKTLKRCKAHFVRKHGRCVKKKPTRHKRSTRHG